jgi:hypothetical protein
MKSARNPYILLFILILAFVSCNPRRVQDPTSSGEETAVNTEEESFSGDDSGIPYALLVSPENPQSGESFRVMAVGGKGIRKAKIEIEGPSSSGNSGHTRQGDGLPFWRVEQFEAGATGQYRAKLIVNRQEVSSQEFSVLAEKIPAKSSGSIWRTERGWDGQYEALYSAWVNALFISAGEGDSWPALHEVTQDPERNILHNYLGWGEDDAAGKTRVIMEPDCADNPFYFRAYFAWKLGLPFGYHESDRGWLGKAPSTGRWITNETPTSRSHPVLSFNAFLRRLMDGVHSGTARAAFSNDNADYYPVPLTREALRPGVTFADPYGHTLILVKWVPQSGNKPGMLLSVDAQPDGTVAIKRFWKGNFLFATTDVIGEPGFKAFRPITLDAKGLHLIPNHLIPQTPNLIPISMQQKSMDPADFYLTMDRVINPKPLDPETALLDLIQALHEQCLTRVNSVANGEQYMQSHPGEVIPMPGRPAGVFQAGGQWEDFSTPNRDLRLLIAMDAILDFPDRVLRTPQDFKMPKLSSPEQVKQKLESLSEKKTSELSITYTRTNGSEQKLTLSELIRRRDAFEMAYNPNDGVEIRWGAPENSEERSTCKRHVSGYQKELMLKVRPWFQKRLHPPT